MASAAMAALGAVAAADQERPAGQGFSFRTAVDLINVTVTVTDGEGRFVQGLRAEDFVLLEDGKPQAVTQFEAERVPVSLGIALDTSGSMVGDKILAAQDALHRFLGDLLGPQDEVFLYRFDSRPKLIADWTDDRRRVAQALGDVKPNGGTAIYDTLVEALPRAQSGSRRKKAVVLISDGNDTSSQTRLADVQQRIRESEVLVYAIGIDASDPNNKRSARPAAAPSTPAPAPSGPQTIPVPSPFPGRGPLVTSAPPPRATPPASTPPASRPRNSSSSVERLNVDALRQITDDTGGRTEIIVSPRDLDPATAGIADELSRQYFLGYSTTLPRDGRWHTIEVRVKRGNYTIRARKGFIAS
jgi:VWFA-related protein